MLDDCTNYWLNSNKFSLQYEIEELGLGVYKNHQLIVIIDSKSVMKFMYPINHFVENELDERETITHDHLENLKNVSKKLTQRLEPEKEKKKRDNAKILKEIQNHNETLEVLWNKIMIKS